MIANIAKTQIRTCLLVCLLFMVLGCNSKSKSPSSLTSRKTNDTTVSTFDPQIGSTYLEVDTCILPDGFESRLMIKLNHEMDEILGRLNQKESSSLGDSKTASMRFREYVQEHEHKIFETLVESREVLRMSFAFHFFENSLAARDSMSSLIKNESSFTTYDAYAYFFGSNLLFQVVQKGGTDEQWKQWEGKIVKHWNTLSICNVGAKYVCLPGLPCKFSILSR